MSVVTSSLIREDISADIWQFSYSFECLQGNFTKTDDQFSADARLEKLEQGSGAVDGATSDVLSREDITKAIQKEINTSDKKKEKREKRKPNILIFDMPEAKEITKEAVKKADLKEFLKVCTDVLEVAIEEEEIKTNYRIGKNDKNKTRPLVVTLTDAGKKREIFTNLHKLSDEEITAPRKE